MEPGMEMSTDGCTMMPGALIPHPRIGRLGCGGARGETDRPAL